MLMPFYCHASAMLLPCYCHAIAMLLPCYCHAIAMLLPCYCHAIAMLLPCYCHAIAMLLPCYCHAIAMLLPCYCHENTLRKAKQPQTNTAKRFRASGLASELKLSMSQETRLWLLNVDALDLNWARVCASEAAVPHCTKSPSRSAEFRAKPTVRSSPKPPHRVARTSKARRGGQSCRGPARALLSRRTA